jgi:hypothetical protein
MENITIVMNLVGVAIAITVTTVHAKSSPVKRTTNVVEYVQINPFVLQKLRYSVGH